MNQLDASLQHSNIKFSYFNFPEGWDLEINKYTLQPQLIRFGT